MRPLRTFTVKRRHCSSHVRNYFLLVALISALLLWNAPAAAQVAAQADFEDGTTDGWTGFGAAQVAVSTAEANTGTHSLLTTNRNQTFNGPGIDLTSVLTPGQPYFFKIAVRLSDNTPGSDSVKLTMRSTITGSPQSFATVASANVTNTGWTLLQGVFTSATTGLTDLFLYVEDDGNANGQYYIDSFSVAPVSGGCTNPPDNSGFSSSFEDGKAEGWSSRGGGAPVVVAPTTSDAHSGSWSLLVTGRTAFWNGPTHDITGKMCNGSQYWLEAWVKLAPGQPTTTVNMSLQLQPLVGTTQFPSVVSATVTSDSWVRLKAKPYTFSGAYTNLQIYFQTGQNSPISSFYVDDVSLTFMPPPVIENIPSIAQTFVDDFPIGFAAVQQDLLGSHGQLAALHYNSVTPGNDLKWDTVERNPPTPLTSLNPPSSFNFGPGDNILTFAQAHNIKMRGHNFVWHNQVPNWVWQDANGVDMSTEPYSDANKALLLSRLKNHIDVMINHYQDKIYVWDVVNEAIDESQADGFRRSKWYMITVDPNNNPGYPEYMDDAFIYARQALDALGIDRKTVELCYNDYNTTISAKRTFIYNWVKGAISRGVPIDCVGNQFHNNINFPINDQGSASSKQSVIDTINLFNSLTSTAGVPIINEITEFDINLYRFDPHCSQTYYRDYDDLLAGDTADLVNQGYRYRDYFQIFKNMKDKIDSVTIWGLGDDDSWLKPSTGPGCPNGTAMDANGPLPFDAYLQHKYAYTGIVNPLALPGANLSLTMTPSSPTPLSGSTVSYLITATNNGPNDAANLTLTTTVPATTTFQSIAPPAGWNCTVGSGGAVTCTGSTLANGGSAKFTLNVTTPCATPDGTSITNSATITSTTLNPNPTPNNSASVSIQVSNPPPVISGLAVNPAVLWPPNHQMVNVALSYSVTHHCDAGLVPRLAVASNQAVNGVGDGNTSSDWQVVDPHDVLLRAERSGAIATDRIYTITLTATDSADASTTASAGVAVPHDSGN